MSATSLYGDLVDPVHLPPRLLRDLTRFDWDASTLKLNWALDTPVPWRARELAGSGTVHLGVDDDGLVDVAADLSVGRMPRDPFVLFGQMATADPTRAPEGGESAWAYTHLPRRWAGDEEAVDLQVRRVEDAVEQVAPGFGAAVRGRFAQRPGDLHDADANLSLGAINGGTAALHQQLVMRPTRGLGRPETPVPGLFLASASAHPGEGCTGRAAGTRPSRRSGSTGCSARPGGP
ncbi:hypothetical protein [Phycicoccus sp. HDW14]|uniref:phytoene desaturase family protein n=1 Tax=Phycicoccus sp. HDW14 TaxID=2714941 RepID=UPI001F0E90CE|nr:hypothetical protein [Phycicoccus sp. HDW14]